MRISFLTLGLRQGGGGSHQNAILFVRALREHGHQVAVYTFRRESDPPPDIEVRSANEGSISFLSALRTRARLMAALEEETDVFLVYGHALLWSAGLYRARGAKPVAVYLDSHLDSMREQYRFSAIHRIKHRLWELLRGLPLARRVDLFLAVSPYLKDRFVKAGFPSEKFAVVPNAFELREPPRRVAGAVPQILFVGRFSFEKGPDLLVEALSHFAHESWQARIVGDGPMRDVLGTRIRAAGLSGRIAIVGWKNKSELAQEYATSDMLVVSSRVPEPFGRSVVEALHAGVPVVIPEQSGAAWVAGDAGVTFKNGDRDSLQNALLKLLNDSSRRRVLGERGRVRARDFDTRIIGAQLSRELEALERRASPR